MAAASASATELLRRANSLPSQGTEPLLPAGTSQAKAKVAPRSAKSAEAPKLPAASMPKVPSFCSVFSPVFELELESARVPPTSQSVLSREPALVAMDRSFSDLQFYRQQMLAGGIPENSSPLQKLLALLKPTTQFEHQLSLHLRQLRTMKGHDEIEAIAAELLALGYLVQIRDGCQPTKDTRSSCLRTLRHRFLVCIGFQEDSYSEPRYLPEPLVVEPRFKEQFLIAHPTLEFELLLQAVPLSYVGGLSRLEAVVHLLAGEIQEAFTQEARPLPPWRTQQAMLSKWAPQQLLDLAKLLCRPAMAYVGDLTGAGDEQQPQQTLLRQSSQPRQQGHQFVTKRRNSVPKASRPSSAATAGPGVPGYSAEAGLFERTPSVPQQQQLLQQLKAQEEAQAAAYTTKMSQAEQPVHQAYRTPFAQAPLHKVLLQVVEDAAMQSADAAAASQAAPAVPHREPNPLLNVQSDTAFTRRSSSDLSSAATKFKSAKSMLAAALKRAPVKDVKRAPVKDVSGSRIVHEEPWARFSTVRWGAAAAANTAAAAAAVQF